MSDAAHARRALAFPVLFVLLWSTGFIAAKYGLPYAPPLTFLLYRFALVAALMTVVALATGARWPASLAEAGHVAVAAWLVHGLYLGGVFVALAGGMPAGTSAMLVGLQPVLTVLIARGWLGEPVVPRQWLGLALGLAGVWLVVRHKVSFSGDFAGLLPSLLALVGISVGTLYQKRFCTRVDLRSGAVIQFAACTLLYLPLVLAFEGGPVRWTPAFVVCAGMVGGRAVGRGDQPAVLAVAPRRGGERRPAVLPRAAGDRRHGLADVRRDARCRRDRRHGADRGRRGDVPPARRGVGRRRAKANPESGAAIPAITRLNHAFDRVMDRERRQCACPRSGRAGMPGPGRPTPTHN